MYYILQKSQNRRNVAHFIGFFYRPVNRNILTQKNSHNFFLCSGRGSDLWSLDLESMLYELSHLVTRFKNDATTPDMNNKPTTLPATRGRERKSG